MKKEYEKTSKAKTTKTGFYINSSSTFSKPFNDSNDFSNMQMSKTSLGDVIVDVLHYSLLTTNDSLGIYSSVISDMIGKSQDVVINTLEQDAVALKKELAAKI